MRRYRPVVTGCLGDSVGDYGERERQHPEDSPNGGGGALGIPAETIRRLAAGVVSIKEGAWFAPTADGTDTGGSANMLAEDRSAPCGATT